MIKLIQKLNIFFNKQKKINKLKQLPLHEPILTYHDQKSLKKCLKSGYVSSVGKFVSLFEKKIKKITKSNFVVATVNGTSSLQIALQLVGLKKNEEVLLPSIGFIATANSVLYNNGIPHFVDIEMNHFGMNPDKLQKFFETKTKVKYNLCLNKKTTRVIRALIVVHVFGHSAQIRKIIKIAKKYKVRVIEDAAEALGSFNNRKHLGTFGDVGILSFNGNKIITTGGGGAILTKRKSLANKALNLTTTFRKKHKWDYIHNKLGYNFRLPNINAALGVSQLITFKKNLILKRNLFRIYKKLINPYKNYLTLVEEPPFSKSNYWLQTVVLKEEFSKKRNFF